MVWLALDARTGLETMLAMPRVAPVAPAGPGTGCSRHAASARLDHPNSLVARVLHPRALAFIAVDRRTGVTLEEWLAQHPQPSTDDPPLWVEAVLRGLAFGHDAGFAHLDLQLHNILSTTADQASVMALGAAQDLEVAPGRPAAASTAT